MTFSFTEVLMLLVIFQLLFTGSFLFSHDRGKKISNRLLSLFFFSLCLNLIDSILLLKGVYEYFPRWAVWASGIPFIYGPLIWFYVRSVLEPSFHFRRRDGWHFLPFVLLTVVSLVSYHAQGRTDQLRVLSEIRERKLPAQVYLVSILIYIHYFWYMFRSLQLVRQYRQKATEKFSNESTVNLRWLRSTLLFFMALMVLSALAGLASAGRWTTLYYLVFAVLLGAFIVFLIQILLKALRNPFLFGGQPVTEPASQPRYQGSSLEDEEKKRLKEVLLNHMSQAKPYLDPDLSLDQLASQLGVRPKLCSQILNEGMGANFFDFVNQYRIEEAKRLLSYPPDPKMTVLEVLYEVGFNSKSSFNTLFKKQTGLTPSEFKKQARSTFVQSKVEPNKGV